MKKYYRVVSFYNGVYSGHTGKFLERCDCGHRHKTLLAASICQDRLFKREHTVKWGFSRIDDEVGRTWEPDYSFAMEK